MPGVQPGVVVTGQNVHWPPLKKLIVLFDRPKHFLKMALKSHVSFLNNLVHR